MPDSIYSRRVTARGIEAGKRFAELAARLGRAPGQLALLWCKDQPGVTAPIVGPRTLAQIEDLLPVLEMTLTDEERAACDTINPPGTAIVNFHNTAAWMRTASDYARLTVDYVDSVDCQSDFPQLLEVGEERAGHRAIIRTPLTTSAVGAEVALAIQPLARLPSGIPPRNATM